MLQSDELPLRFLVSDRRIAEIFVEEGISLGQDDDAVYTPAITLWGLLSQVLFKEEQRSCRPGVRIVGPLAGVGANGLQHQTDWLITYLSGSDKMQRTLENVGLDFSKDAIVAAKQQAEWRRVIQFTLHQQIFAGSGANDYTPFFIRSKDVHNDYWLIHLSNHSR